MGRKVVSFSVDHFVHWVYSISLQRLSASLLFFFLLQSSDLLHDHNKYVFRTSSFFFSFSFFFKSSVSRPQQVRFQNFSSSSSSSSSSLFLSHGLALWLQTLKNGHDDIWPYNQFDNFLRKWG
ncbi:hypothetical protein KY284_027058 [Solanum tuberosum]|nr:hypothetical protein KY284_027058 [Solanum tuberosum]